MELTLPPNDPRVHVLAVSDEGAPLPEQTYLTGPAPDPDQEQLRQVIGGEVAMAHVEVFRIKELLPLSLRDYLHQAHDVPKDVLGRDAARLDALDGQVVVLAPAALRGLERLSPQKRLTHIGAFGAPVPDDTPGPLPKAGRQKQAADSGMVGEGARTRSPMRWVVVAGLLAAALLVFLVSR